MPLMTTACHNCGHEAKDHDRLGSYYPSAGGYITAVRVDIGGKCNIAHCKCNQYCSFESVAR